MKTPLFSDLFAKCLLKLEADFTSEYDLRSASSSLSKAIGIKVGNVESKWSLKLEILESKLFHLTTDFINHSDMRLLIINFHNWIKKDGKTSTFCDFNISVKFNDDIRSSNYTGSLFSNDHKIEKLDKIKFVVNFDEPFVYSVFPKRTNTYNAQTIRQISSLKGHFNVSQKIESGTFDIAHNPFMGINFEHLSRGYLTMNYLGGLDYQYKTNDILKIVNHFCEVTYLATTQKNSYSSEETILFNKIVNRTKKMQKSYENLEMFKESFPNVKFLVNLVEDDRVLKTFYFTLRDRIYDIFSNIKFLSTEEFFLNYDSTTQALQLKDANIECLNLKNLQFIECKIKGGSFDFCDFFKCEINKSYMLNSNIFADTRVISSKMIDCFSNRTTTLKDSFIDGQNSTTNANVEGGIIAKTNKGIYANISDSTVKGKIVEIKPGFLVVGPKVIIDKR